eukprot:4483028-Amphidinium_carterae.1
MLWEEGAAKGRVGDTLSALQWQLPALKGRRSEGWRLFAGWGRVERVTRAAPIPHSVKVRFKSLCGLLSCRASISHCPGFLAVQSRPSSHGGSSPAACL